MKASYTSQLAFLKTQVEDGSIIDAATCVNINEGEKTILTQDDEEVFHFSEPVPCEEGFMEAENKTGSVQDLAIGFVSPGELFPTPAHYYNDLGDGSTAVAATFTPKLRAYITSDYQESAILRSAIHTPCIFEYDLASLAENTTWNLTFDHRNGYKVSKADRQH